METFEYALGNGEYITMVREADAHSEIARLTATLETAIKEQDRLAKAWEAKHAYQVNQEKNHADYFDKSQRRMHELAAERDTARAETARWQADANLMIGFAELAYEAGAMPSSSELIAARDRALAARDKATREQALREAADLFPVGGRDGQMIRDRILAMIEKETDA